MSTQEIISLYLNAIAEAIKEDASAKGQKIPVASFRVDADQTSGRFYAADYFQYLVSGRGPGKFPPPEKMEEYIRNNLHILDSARDIYKNISIKSLAFLIGRKIAKKGTDIFEGKNPGIDLQGSIEGSMDNFLQMLAYYEALNVFTKIKQAA